MIENSKGKIFYGMHFYPGVARYEAPDKEALTVFINEDTIRKMGPSFAGRPIFVEHVDEVDSNINDLREDADGWVIESFYNAADGKTWCKFIVVSEIGLQAIQRGYRLSNAYIPQLNNKGGVWNGVPFQQEVVGGEFEHLAIVMNPRYEESIILTPEEFKSHNEEKTVELKKLANSKDKKGERTMKLNIFKRTKIENSIDLDGMIVELPISKKEMALTKVIEELDKIMNMNGYANGDHMVKVGDKDEMSVNDLVKKHLELTNEVAKSKEDAVENDAADDKKENEDDDSSMDNDKSDDDKKENKEDDDKKEDKKMNEITVAQAKEVIAREKAKALKNANLKLENEESVSSISLPQDMVARGKSRYGSTN